MSKTLWGNCESSGHILGTQLGSGHTSLTWDTRCDSSCRQWSQIPEDCEDSQGEITKSRLSLPWAQFTFLFSSVGPLQLATVAWTNIWQYGNTRARPSLLSMTTKPEKKEVLSLWWMTHRKGDYSHIRPLLATAGHNVPNLFIMPGSKPVERAWEEPWGFKSLLQPRWGRSAVRQQI